MRHRYYLISSVFVLALLLTWVVAPVGAQGGEGETCQQFVSRVMSELGTNCANQDGNTVCYGFNDVTGMVIEGEVEPDDFFDEVGYRFPLDQLARVSGSPFDFENKTWGVSVLKVLAYPVMDEEADTASMTEEPIEPKEIVIFMIGDVTLENDVLPTYDDEGNLVVDAETPGPMQVNFLRNGHTTPACEEAIPPMLLVQGPEDATVDITINGMVIRLNATDPDSQLTPFGTTVALNVLPTEEDMEISTLFGLATLAPGTPEERLVPPGFSSIACLALPEDLGLDGESNDQLVSCPASEPDPLTADFLDILQLLEELPDNVLNFQIQIPVIVGGSGVGGPVNIIVFDSQGAVQLAQAACDAGLLPQAVCDYLF